MFFVLFFHVVCRISNFNMLTTKHLAQASCTELTLLEQTPRLVENFVYEATNSEQTG